MDSSLLIEKFLERIVKRRSRIYALTGLYLILASLAGGFLAGNLIGYFYTQTRGVAVPFLLLWCLPFFYVFVRYFLRGAFSPFTLDQAALLAEKKIQGLNNSLISSVQLKRRLAKADHTKGISTSLINELIKRTEAKISGIEADSLISGENVRRSRNLFAGVLGALLTAMLFLPDFVARGYGSWFAAPALTNREAPFAGPGGLKAPGDPSRPYSIENLALTFNYPDYTGLKSVTLKDSDGKVQVIPGTEVLIEARANLPLSGAELLLNGEDGFIMTAGDGNNFSGQFIAREDGYYQFRLRSPKGGKNLLPAKYPVTLGKDQPPGVKIILDNPKPLYFMTDKIQFIYESFDDFGIRKIDLVVNTNGNIQRAIVKTFKTTPKKANGSYSWKLGFGGFSPGDKVLYYLEASDNDNVSGPNMGRSEIYSFEIFDEEKKRKDLLALQDELLEKMIDLLAENLVVNLENLKGSPHERTRLKKMLASSADQLIAIIALAQSIKKQAMAIESFPKIYITLLENIISGLRELRNEQINVMDQISAEFIKTSALGRDFPPVKEMNANLVARLETNILFLAKIIARERMHQVKLMEKDIAKLTDSLRSAFEKIKNKEAPLDEAQFKSAIEKIKETLQKIMDQLARQNQAMPDEFLNPNSFENISMESLSASLEKMKDLIKKGLIDEAMKELERLTEDLNALSRQLDDASKNMGDLVDMEIMKKLDDSLRKILKLEKDQKELLQQTTAINKSLREKQSREFASRLQNLFALLRKDVNQIQTILKKDDRYLEEHPAMKVYNELLEKEAEIKREIDSLSQQTMNLAGNEKISLLFSKLKEARGRLSQVASKMFLLRMKVFRDFKEFLPLLFEKYGKLEEMAKIQDLFEFNSFFKNTYPEILRWQNRFRGSRRTREDVRDKLNHDLRKVALLNIEISKKLGTMMRDLNQNFQTLLGEQNKKRLEMMAGKQNKMSKKAQEVADQFSEMNRENPMITPRLANKMAATGKYMERAEHNLNNHQVSKSIDAENKSLAELEETRKLLRQMKNQDAEETGTGKKKKLIRLGMGQSRDNKRGGSVRMKKDNVDLPSEDQYQAPGRFREDILKAMKNKYPQNYERLVMEYYKELVK